MSTLLSAGISVTESDLISYIPPVSSSIAAYVGHFNWGPADELVNVNSEKALATIFGAPNINAHAESNFITSYLTAAAFFQYGNSMRVVRSVSDSATNAVGYMETYGNSSATGLLIRNKEAFDIHNFATLSPNHTHDLIFARYPGNLGNGLEVQFYHFDNCPPSDISVSNSLAKDCKSYFGKLPTTTYWASNSQVPFLENDEIYITVTDSLGYISGSPGTILESYQGLSLSSGAKTSTGSNNYYVDAINEGSSYIYINETAHNYGVLATLHSGSNMYNLTHENANFIFTGGLNGTSSDLVFSSDNVYKSLTLLLFLDTENTIIDLLCAESFESDTIGSNPAANAKVKNQLLSIAETRRDLMVFISAPLDLYRQQTTQKLQWVLSGRDNLSDPSSSFSFYDNTPVYVYNKYTDKYYWTPACTHMAGLCAFTDSITDPWFSPAGLNRGSLRGVTKLAYNAAQQDRDDLYNDNINAIISIPGSGIVLYGDKTGLSRPSSFDRINVRRLFINIEKACRKASRYQLFELNDEFTQRAFRNTINPYLRDIQSRRGIIDFAVVCDSTNNTPAVVSSNRFVADIYIKPAFSINYIQLNFIATRDTITFTQISG